MCLFAMISLRVCPRSVLPERVDLSSALTDTTVCEFGIACVQTYPISFVARGKRKVVPFPRATKEIRDVCTRAKFGGMFGQYRVV